MVGDTPVMLAASKGHTDVVLTLVERGAHLNLVDIVSILINMLYFKPCITEDKYNTFILRRLPWETWPLSDSFKILLK